MPGYKYRGNQPWVPPEPFAIPECGTEAGAARHRKLGEPVDEDCRKARNLAEQRYRQRRRRAQKALS